MGDSKRAVVAGAAGFIGSHLTDALLAMGFEVVGLDNLSTGRESNLRFAVASRAFTFYETDITAGLPDLEPATVVYNLACPASPEDYLRLPLETMEVCAVGTKNLLDFATAVDAHFVLASTSEIYGDPLEHPQTEQYWGNVNPTGVRSVYDEGKRYAEALTAAYSRKMGTRTSILRLFNTYGERMRLDDSRAVPSMMREAVDNRPITIHGDGWQTRSLCYVEDTVRAFSTLASMASVGTVNIGTLEEVSMRRLAATIAFLSESRILPEFVQGRSDDPSRRRPNTDRARARLGWSPRVGLEDGLRRTLEDVRRRLLDKSSESLRDLVDLEAQG